MSNEPMTRTRAAIVAAAATFALAAAIVGVAFLAARYPAGLLVLGAMFFLGLIGAGIYANLRESFGDDR